MIETESRTGAEDVRWDLGDLYAGPEDPALERDLTEPVEAARRFAATYRGRVGELAAAELAAACAAQEAVVTPLRRASSFADLRFSADTSDPARGALVSRADEQATAASTELLFFELEWLAVDEERAAALLADPALAAYRHHLEALRRYRPHVLSEPEERILNELDQTGPSAWQRLFTQLTSAITVPLHGRDQPLMEALGTLYEPEQERRREAQVAVTGALRADLGTRAFVFNTLLHDRGIKDRLRGHPHWLHRRNLANEADDHQVAALVEAVVGRYDLVARYYRLKGRLLGLEPMHDYDRYAPLPGEPSGTLAWEDARALVLDAYGEFSPEMRDLAATFFERGWIDAPAVPAKRGGAFAHPVTPDVHPYILLNYTGRRRDAMTLAHELGHGIHMRLSQRQTLFNADTPLTTAETASIFGETVTLSKLLAAESDPATRLALLAGRLDDVIASIFRQVAMYRFEDSVHTARRERGELSIEDFDEAWHRTQSEMFGGSVVLTDEYRVWWSYVPHFIHTPGYVYAYSFGNLLAFALYRRYQEEGRAVVPRYLEMLAAGGSIAPNELVRRAGVDLTDPAFWNEGLDVLAEEIAEAERLATHLT